jgi:hypothetical protein
MFANTSAIQTLKDRVKHRISDIDFDAKWQTVVATFSEWESSAGQNTSDLNVRLEFLERVCAAFPHVPLHRDNAIVDLLLSDSGARNVGHTFKCQLPDGRCGTTRIVNRKITDRFGVLYTLETAEGFRFTREFFD